MTLTIVDKLVPQYVRFLWGYGYVSLVLALISFGMAMVTMLTVKGIYIPLWALGGIGLAVIGFCTFVGYISETRDIQNRIASHANTRANPELKQLCADIDLIKKKLERRHVRRSRDWKIGIRR